MMVNCDPVRRFGVGGPTWSVPWHRTGFERSGTRCLSTYNWLQLVGCQGLPVKVYLVPCGAEVTPCCASCCTIYVWHRSRAPRSEFRRVGTPRQLLLKLHFSRWDPLLFNSFNQHQQSLIILNNWWFISCWSFSGGHQ